MAMRIMSEREADHSDDYAALLDCLVRSHGGLKGRGQARVLVQSTSPIVEPGTAEREESALKNVYGGGKQLCARTSGDKPEIGHVDQQRPRHGA
jgi:hypothetical protein